MKKMISFLILITGCGHNFNNGNDWKNSKPERIIKNQSVSFFNPYLTSTNTFESLYIKQIIDSLGGKSVSLAFSNRGVLKLHCVYEKDNKIYYSEKIKNGPWTPPFILSHPNKPAYNPSIEVHGDSLYAVWKENYDGRGEQEVFRRRKKVTTPYYAWSNAELISKNLQNYDFR
ncbi:MAG: hypothetical protein ABIM60_05415 [candidate division WOR-3 bacterium]